MTAFLSTITGEKRERFILEYGEQLLTVIGQSPEFERFLTEFEADHRGVLGKFPQMLRFYGDCLKQQVLKDGSLGKRIQAWEYLAHLEAKDLTSEEATVIRKHMATLKSGLDQETRDLIQHRFFILLAQACITHTVLVTTAVFVLGPAIMNAGSSFYSESIYATWDELCALAIEDKDLLSHATFTWDLMRVRAGVIKNDPQRRRIILERPGLSPMGVRLLKRLSRKTRTVLEQDKNRWSKESQLAWEHWMKAHGRRGIFGRMRRLFDRK